jgi:ABC-type Fe3+-hydroxamate transport system substrate-binding protein
VSAGVTVRDDHGVEIAVDATPRRVVSLVPSVSEAIATWGLLDRLVGVTDWCTTPAFPAATRVRGTKNPDVAAIVSLAPDLVVANEEENRRVDVEALRAAGIAVYVTAPDSLASAAASLERLSSVLGAGERGEQLARSIREAIGTAPPARLRTFCPVWRDPWIAVGTRTIAGDLLRHAGFDVVPDVERYPRVDLSAIAETDPDVVLLPDEPYAFGEADAAPFLTWRATVCHIDGADLTWWGPRTVGALVAFRDLAASVAASAA